MAATVSSTSAVARLAGSTSRDRRPRAARARTGRRPWTPAHSRACASWPGSGRACDRRRPRPRSRRASAAEPRAACANRAKSMPRGCGGRPQPHRGAAPPPRAARSSDWRRPQARSNSTAAAALTRTVRCALADATERVADIADLRRRRPIPRGRRAARRAPTQRHRGHDQRVVVGDEHELGRGKNAEQDHTDRCAGHEVEPRAEADATGCLSRGAVRHRQGSGGQRRDERRRHEPSVCAVDRPDDGGHERAGRPRQWQRSGSWAACPEAVSDSPDGLDPARLEGSGSILARRRRTWTVTVVVSV